MLVNESLAIQYSAFLPGSDLRFLPINGMNYGGYFGKMQPKFIGQFSHLFFPSRSAFRGHQIHHAIPGIFALANNQKPPKPGMVPGGVGR